MAKKENAATSAPDQKTKVDAIVSSIRNDVELKIRNMESAYASKIASAEDESKKRMANEKESLDKETAREKMLMENRMMAEADLVSRRTISGERERLMGQALSTAKELMLKERSTCSAAYKEYVKRKAEDAKSILPKGSAAQIIKGDEISSILSSAGYKVEATLDQEYMGGVIFHSPDGKTHLDATLLHVMESEITHIRSMLATVLFHQERER
ncbi:MAG: hypothetical protein QCI38_00120 [Candidatus Thermoplasmatota archaeon]|nr:hypothetical protein [Candidatus Thermoplasmatota archaeon]